MSASAGDANGSIAIEGGTSSTLIGNVGDSLKTSESEWPTFSVMLTDIASANNKSLVSIGNASGSTVKVKIREIRIINTRNAAAAGVVADLNLYRCTSHSAGTDVTPLSADTTDTLDSLVTVKTNATITGEGTAIVRHWDLSTDEWGPGTADAESTDHALQTLIAAYSPVLKSKPLTLNANEGFTLKCVTNTTTGLFDILIVFTQE